MNKPRLLDLFCCAGGAATGYALAGFDVTGIDIDPQPHYPFTFIQAEALEYLDTANLASFDVIHASPECKGYTDCNLSPKDKYQRLIGEVRLRLERIGKPFIIENVMGARYDLHASLMLCGTMFGLPMERHRLFESNVFLYPPRPCDHSIAHIAVYGHSVWDSWLPGTPRKNGRSRPDSVPLAIGREAMQCPWMGINELAEAIPPAYTHHIGEQLIAALKMEEGAA